MNRSLSARSRNLTSLGLALLGAACASLQLPPRANVELRETTPVSVPAKQTPGAWPSADWWRSYGDATLDTLIDRAIGAGPGIAEADARIRAAEEEVNV